MKMRIIGILILSLALVLCACTPSSPPKPDDTGSDTESEKFKTESETKAESKPGSEEESQMETGTCKLTFSSFDGGGYKYKVIIEDPEILTYEMKYDYGDQPDDEPIDGASFDMVIIFQGLKPGTTGLTIACSSPIADNYDLLYQASVDESLNVTLTGEQMISRFLLSRSGKEIDDYYVLEFTEGECFLSADGESFQKVDKAVMSALYDVYEAYDVASWDGFSESTHAAQGEQFLVEIRLTDGTSVRAIGDFVYPDHYFEVMEKWSQILHQAAIGSQ